MLTTKEIKTNYMPYTYIMLITNFNNFEMFVSPYCLLSIDHSTINNPQIYAFIRKY